MANNFKIYTKLGDFGETSLCDGSRTGKDSARVEAYGSVDEVNSFIGLCIATSDDNEIKDELMNIQRDLHSIGSNLAYPADLTQSIIDGKSIAAKIPKITDEAVEKLEKWIDKYDLELPKLKYFILAGGTELSALLHVARTVCRRAEREIVRLKHHEEINKNVLRYVNRLSDYLFTVARIASHRKGKDDIKWVPGL